MARFEGYWSIRQVANHLGIHPETLRKWERSGKIPPATRFGFGKRTWRVYSQGDVAALEASLIAPPVVIPADIRA